MTEKHCPRCDRTLSAESFWRGGKRGLDGWCKECRTAWRRENSAIVNAARAEWLTANPGKRKQYNRTAYLKSDKAARREYARSWYHANIDKARESVLRRTHERNARKRQAPSERFSRREIFERDGGKCHLCGKKVLWKDYHLDHLIPLARGGGHLRSNVAVSHSWCNLSRAADRADAQLLLVG